VARDIAPVYDKASAPVFLVGHYDWMFFQGIAACRFYEPPHSKREWGRCGILGVGLNKVKLLPLVTARRFILTGACLTPLLARYGVCGVHRRKI
jgi:hypothetical protein